MPKHKIEYKGPSNMVMLLLVSLAVYISIVSTFEFKLDCYDDVVKCFPDSEENIFKALQNQHIVFIGESLMRYQYLSLVYLLRHRHWPSNDMKPSIFEEHVFDNFNEFFVFTKGMLTPYEECDCYRDKNAPSAYYMFENRYYHDPKHNITVTYIWYIVESVGHWSFAESRDKSITKYFPHTDIKRIPEKWFLHLEDIGSKYIATFDPLPSVVILNIGRWGQALTEEQVAAMMFDMMTFVKVFVWRTSPYSWEDISKGHQEARIQNNDKQFEPYSDVATVLDVSWTKKLNPNIHYNVGDGLHFRAPIYNLMNIQLMETITKMWEELGDN